MCATKSAASSKLFKKKRNNISFHEIRFPTDISYGSSGGPEFNTDVVITNGGYEQRNINWSDARAKYNVAHGVKTPEQLKELISFFRARQGRAFGFRFKDWADFSASDEVIGSGDGVINQFQLKKTYTSSVSVARDIKKIVSGTTKIYFDDVEQISGFSVNENSGVVTFASAPAVDVVITADFEFDVPVRFDTDRLSARLESYGVSSWNEIPLVEVRI